MVPLNYFYQSSIQFAMKNHDLLLIIPSELSLLVLNLLDASSVFSLSLTSRTYRRFEIIRVFFSKIVHGITYDIDEIIVKIRIDTIINGHMDLFKCLVS